MQIAVLGTGMVGRAHAARLTELGHTVTIGTRDPEQLRLRTDQDAMGNPPFSEWHADHTAVNVASLSAAAGTGELIINALNGAVSVPALTDLTEAIGDKVVLDLANPLDFSQGSPPTLFVSNTDSLGEQIQAALPKAKVVKTCNTTTASVQVNPASVAEADHHIFVSGNDAAAKRAVTALLQEYGWKHIIDLGDITTARGQEMLLPLWLRLFGTLNTPNFNFKVVQANHPSD